MPMSVQSTYMCAMGPCCKHAKVNSKSMVMNLNMANLKNT